MGWIVASVLLVALIVQGLLARKNAGELRVLKARISLMVTEPLDRICWRDLYTELGTMVGITFDPILLPRDQFLGQCARFHDSVREQTPYRPDELTLRFLILEATAEGYKELLDRFASEYHRLRGNAGEPWQTCISHQLCVEVRAPQIITLGRQQ